MYREYSAGIPLDSRPVFPPDVCRCLVNTTRKGVVLLNNDLISGATKRYSVQAILQFGVRARALMHPFTKSSDLLSHARISMGKYLTSGPRGREGRKAPPSRSSHKSGVSLSLRLARVGYFPSFTRGGLACSQAGVQEAGKGRCVSRVSPNLTSIKAHTQLWERSPEVPLDPDRWFTGKPSGGGAPASIG